MGRKQRQDPPEVCPVCGADVPREALACPGCGSDDTSGWSDQARYDSLDLPDQEFDYEDFVGRELGGPPKPAPRRWLWAMVAAGLLVALLAWLFGGFFSR